MNNRNERVGPKKNGPCPPNITKQDMQAISAPYNFVPLPRWVHTPEWSQQVSHDRPFADGLSGEIVYHLVAESPLLVGGHQDKTAEPQRVEPFQLPDGSYAIPGSSVKGMLRAVLEIAGFGRMRMVDDARPGLRDITGPFVKEAYTAKVRDKMQTGFLRQAGDSGLEIVPCKMARLDHRDLEDFLSSNPPIFKSRLSVKEKYQRWQEHCRNQSLDPASLPFELDGRDAKPRRTGAKTGVPVFTGQISDSTKRHGKRRDFLFYDRDEQAAIPVPTAAWRDFLRIHGDEDKRAGEMSWPGHWKQVYRGGGEVPVFYLKDGELLRIGLAYMPKLAGDFSIREMIGHASTDHGQAPGSEHGYDLADLLFGAINGERQQDALRGRVSCETLRVAGRAEAEKHDDTILNGPKPTYFPSYVEQQADTTTWKLRSSEYATYVRTKGSNQPVVRGFKRYPARPASETRVQPLTEEQKANKKVQAQLRTLKPGARFEGRIVYHNLRPSELGALLWGMTWGGNAQLRHGLGMGKPFGFGQVRLEVDHAASAICPNKPDEPERPLTEEAFTELLGAFSEYMESVCRGAGHGWRASPQIANLLAMADPSAAEALPAGLKLRHMALMQCRRDGRNERINEFQWAKQQPPGPFVLADYAMAVGRSEGTGGGSGGHTPLGGASDLHPWVRQKIGELMKKLNAPEGDVLRGRRLAEAWSELEDPDLKQQVLSAIRTRWKAEGWWDNPPGKASRKAKEIYTAGGE